MSYSDYDSEYSCDDCCITTPVEDSNTECVRCGCNPEENENGDRNCYCIGCQSKGGCRSIREVREVKQIKGCIRCGCSAEKDEYGDRICYCATCRSNGGCFHIKLKSNTECITCGCSAEKDEYGDRICYCATCKYNGGCIIGPKRMLEDDDDDENNNITSPLYKLKKIYERARWCNCVFGDFEKVCSDCEKNINIILENVSNTMIFP